MFSVYFFFCSFSLGLQMDFDVKMKEETNTDEMSSDIFDASTDILESNPSNTTDVADLSTLVEFDCDTNKENAHNRSPKRLNTSELKSLDIISKKLKNDIILDNSLMLNECKLGANDKTNTKNEIDLMNVDNQSAIVSIPMSDGIESCFKVPVNPTQIIQNSEHIINKLCPKINNSRNVILKTDPTNSNCQKRLDDDGKHNLPSGTTTVLSYLADLGKQNENNQSKLFEHSTKLNQNESNLEMLQQQQIKKDPKLSDLPLTNLHSLLSNNNAMNIDLRNGCYTSAIGNNDNKLNRQLPKQNVKLHMMMPTNLNNITKPSFVPTPKYNTHIPTSTVHWNKTPYMGGGGMSSYFANKDVPANVMQNGRIDDNKNSPIILNYKLNYNQTMNNNQQELFKNNYFPQNFNGAKQTVNNNHNNNTDNNYLKVFDSWFQRNIMLHLQNPGNTNTVVQNHFNQPTIEHNQNNSTMYQVPPSNVPQNRIKLKLITHDEFIEQIGPDILDIFVQFFLQININNVFNKFKISSDSTLKMIKQYLKICYKTIVKKVYTYIGGHNIKDFDIFTFINRLKDYIERRHHFNCTEYIPILKKVLQESPDEYCRYIAVRIDDYLSVYNFFADDFNLQVLRNQINISKILDKTTKNILYASTNRFDKPNGHCDNNKATTTTSMKYHPKKDPLTSSFETRSNTIRNPLASKSENVTTSDDKKTLHKLLDATNKNSEHVKMNETSSIEDRNRRVITKNIPPMIGIPSNKQNKNVTGKLNKTIIELPVTQIQENNTRTASSSLDVKISLDKLNAIEMKKVDTIKCDTIDNCLLDKDGSQDKLITEHEMTGSYLKITKKEDVEGGEEEIFEMKTVNETKSNIDKNDGGVLKNDCDKISYETVTKKEVLLPPEYTALYDITGRELIKYFYYNAEDVRRNENDKIIKTCTSDNDDVKTTVVENEETDTNNGAMKLYINKCELNNIENENTTTKKIKREILDVLLDYEDPKDTETEFHVIVHKQNEVIDRIETICRKHSMNVEEREMSYIKNEIYKTLDGINNKNNDDYYDDCDEDDDDCIIVNKENEQDEPVMKKDKRETTNKDIIHDSSSKNNSKEIFIIDSSDSDDDKKTVLKDIKCVEKEHLITTPVIN